MEKCPFNQGWNLVSNGTRKFAYKSLLNLNPSQLVSWFLMTTSIPSTMTTSIPSTSWFLFKYYMDWRNNPKAPMQRLTYRCNRFIEYTWHTYVIICIIKVVCVCVSVNIILIHLIHVPWQTVWTCAVDKWVSPLREMSRSHKIPVLEP